MLRTKILICFLCLISTVVCSYAAGDQQVQYGEGRQRQRQYGEDRQRAVRPSVAPPDAVVQRPQPVLQQNPSNQRNNERSQNQRSGASSGRVRDLQMQPQVVNIDQLKLQADTPEEYSFRTLQTLVIQDGEHSSSETEVKTEQVEAAAEEQQDAAVEEFAASESLAEETGEAAEPAEEQVVHANGGNAQFLIVEENNRIIVTQVEAAPIPKGSAR
jgi:hypothetical protein